jgi:hypothetical protein
MGADDMKKIISAVAVGGFPERSEDLLNGMQISIAVCRLAYRVENQPKCFFSLWKVLQWLRSVERQESPSA